MATTRGIFERTLRFYRGIGIDSATVGIVVPMPGTPFFDEMVRTGRPLTTDWDRYNGKVDAVFRPRNMSPWSKARQRRASELSLALRFVVSAAELPKREVVSRRFTIRLFG